MSQSHRGARRAAQRLARSQARLGDGRLSASERRAACRQASAQAEKLGLLIRPDACERCGEDRYLTRHHADYTEPLLVEYLCEDCHAEADAEIRARGGKTRTYRAQPARWDS